MTDIQNNESMNTLEQLVVNSKESGFSLQQVQKLTNYSASEINEILYRHGLKPLVYTYQTTSNTEYKASFIFSLVVVGIGLIYHYMLVTEMSSFFSYFAEHELSRLQNEIRYIFLAMFIISAIGFIHWSMNKGAKQTLNKEGVAGFVLSMVAFVGLLIYYGGTNGIFDNKTSEIPNLLNLLNVDNITGMIDPKISGLFNLKDAKVVAIKKLWEPIGMPLIIASGIGFLFSIMGASKSKPYKGFAIAGIAISLVTTGIAWFAYN